MEKEKLHRGELKLIGIQIRTNNLNESNPSSARIPQCVMKYYQEQVGDKIPHRKNPGTTIAAYTNYESDHTGDYTYFLGEEVDELDKVPTGLSTITIPPQNYVKFTSGPAPMPEVCIKAWNKIWQMSPTELGNQRNYQADFEVYDERAADFHNTTLDIYVGLKS
jgi:predicted transcriptional regulator YdeE